MWGEEEPGGLGWTQVLGRVIGCACGVAGQWVGHSHGSWDFEIKCLLGSWANVSNLRLWGWGREGEPKRANTP